MDDLEYQALRAEEETHFRVMNQHLMAAGLSTGAILALAGSVAEPSSLLFLAPLAVILPSAFGFRAGSEAVCG